MARTGTESRLEKGLGTVLRQEAAADPPVPVDHHGRTPGPVSHPRLAIPVRHRDCSRTVRGVMYDDPEPALRRLGAPAACRQGRAGRRGRCRGCTTPRSEERRRGRERRVDGRIPSRSSARALVGGHATLTAQRRRWRRARTRAGDRRSGSRRASLAPRLTSRQRGLEPPALPDRLIATRVRRAGGPRSPGYRGLSLSRPRRLPRQPSSTALRAWRVSADGPRSGAARSP